jgi:two-component system, OmpR family, phosphate regulon sensor histidine kinase PhoR
MTARVLVIDDEYGVRTGVRQILEMEGYVVRDVETGRDALAALSEAAFDIALIDYQLPDVDGLTLLASIRDQHPGTMTCMITAYANIDTAIAATRQGIDFFLPKPFTPEDLVGVVSTLTRHKRLREDAEILRREHEQSLFALATEQSQTRSLVASMRDAVLVVNRDGEIALVNQAMARFLGKAESELVHARAEDLIGLAPLASIRELLRPTAAERGVSEVELGDKTYMASVAEFKSASGETLGRILTIADTTELRRMAMEKSRFIRTMVHEFRSPIGAVRSLLDVALDASLGHELAAYVPLLQRATARLDGLGELIGDLLSLSRIDLERQRAVPPGGTELSSAVQAAVDVHQTRADLRGICVSVAIAPDLPHVAIGSDELRTVLVNLVGNAVKYNRDAGRVALRASGADGSVTMEIEDTGIGIRAANVPNLFEEFYREKRPETRDIEGNGLGLSIVKRLVEKAGGNIDVSSIESKGTTFRVCLPAANRPAS